MINWTELTRTGGYTYNPMDIRPDNGSYSTIFGAIGEDIDESTRYGYIRFSRLK
jgi:hypothetical protein